MYLDRIFVHVNGEQLKAVLVAVASRLDGFGLDDIDQFCSDVAALTPDDDVLIEPDISYQEASLPFAVDVFKDAQGSLDLVFLLAPVLTSLVRDVAASIVGASAVRSMVAQQTVAPN